MADSQNAEINERVMRELHEAEVERGRPLLVVDADEVLVEFATHFRDYCVGAGYSFNLTEYSLDSALRDSQGRALSREQITPLIWGFIETHTHEQWEIPGAAAALADLSSAAQIVVLTNAPFKMRAERIANLTGLGMDYPVVMNEGGKGRALRWLAERADAPMAFVDDSVAQIGSAAKHAPDATLLHLVGSDLVRGIVAPAEKAHHHPNNWDEAAPLIRAALA